MKPILSKQDMILAELYATEIVTLCLAHAYLESKKPDHEQAARDLAALAHNTAEKFTILGPTPEITDSAREAIIARIDDLIASAANPYRMDAGC